MRDLLGKAEAKTGVTAAAAMGSFEKALGGVQTGPLKPTSWIADPETEKRVKVCFHTTWHEGQLTFEAA